MTPKPSAARHLLLLIPRTDQRELIRADLDEELARRLADEPHRARAWYWAATFESVSDWWLGRLSFRRLGRGGPAALARSPGGRSGGWLADLRFAVRMLSREKVVSAAVVLTVMIGVSSTAAVATLLRGVLLRPLPYPDADQIVRVSRASDAGPAPFPVVGLPDLEDWRERSRSLSMIAGWSGGGATLTGRGRAERISIARVTIGLDRVLAIEPALGRFFGPQDFEIVGGNLAIVSFAFWRDRLGADPDAIGRTIELDSQSVTVVGVLPRTDLPYPTAAEVWLPLAPPPDSWMYTVRGSSWLNGVGRVKDGVGIESAEAELSAIQHALADEFPRDNEGQDAVHLERLKEVIVAPARPAIRIMTATIGLVLLLASINVGLLLLARSNRRREEFSVRTVLGAERGRLRRLILTEALLLAAIGGALGLPLAIPLIDAMVSLYPGGLPRAAELRLDGWVMVASLSTIAIAGGLASLAPAWSLSKIDLASRLRLRSGGSTRGQARVRSVLVGTQLALSGSLLIVATLLSRTLVNLRDADPGFEPNRALTFSLAPAASRYSTDPDVVSLYRRILSDIETVPGVLGAGAVNFLPFTAGDWGGGFEVRGETHQARVRLSWPGYYEALGLRLARGRLFDWRDDTDGPPVAMLNEAAARIAFGTEDPLGRQIAFEGVQREVVGVLEDVRHRSLVDPAAPEVHVPSPQFARISSSLVVRTQGDPLSVLGGVRTVMESIDPNIPLTSVATMGDRIERSIAPERFRATLVTALGGLAALLALIGVYGVMSYAVAQRRREIGIRCALGESERSIRARVVRSAGALAATGVGIGVVVAWIASRWLESLLYSVDARDPVVFVTVSLVLLTAGTASALGPAVRASRVDPLITIREE
ncbi:MAG: ABC transporter permease [Gemmatimonadota bacterium]|nr:ABC transporter permease [Gemmatimonadota bacterium]